MYVVINAHTFNQIITEMCKNGEAMERHINELDSLYHDSLAPYALRNMRWECTEILRMVALLRVNAIKE